MTKQPVRMRCKAHERCGDTTCTHREEHDYNAGCEYFCHFSDFTKLCEPVSKGWKKEMDNIKLNWKVWLGIKERLF